MNMTAAQLEANIEAINEFLRVNYSPTMSDANFKSLITDLREYRAELRRVKGW